jgi:Ion channel
VLSKLLVGWGLMAVCVVIHATGVTAMLRRARLHVSGRPRPWRLIWLFVRLAGWIVFLHLIEIAVWAAYYVWQEAMPDFQTAAYFSAVTYTTTGYGDLVLSPEWRLVGAIEALTGILMCGWSTGFFFAIVRWIQTEEARPLDSTS